MYRNFPGVLGTVIEIYSCFTKAFIQGNTIGMIFLVYFIFVNANRNGI